MMSAARKGSPLIDLEAYRDQGFVLQKALFAPSEVEQVRQEAKEIFIAQMLRHDLVQTDAPSEQEFEMGMYELFKRDLQAFTNCGKQAQHLISLHRVSLEARVIERLQALGVTRPNISTRPVLYFNAQRLATKEVYWRLSFHQDWRSMQGSLDSVVVWLPLIDITKDLGALELIPGSHKWGLLAADIIDGYGNLRDAIDESERVSAEVEQGDALFFSTLLVHRSGTNTTNSIRWSCHFRYNNLSDSTFIERGFPHPYVYHPQADLITPDFPTQAQVLRTLSNDK